jgi:hypothetical protein
MVAKRQILPMVGTVFLHQIVAPPLSKYPCTIPLLAFYQTDCDNIFVGYSLSHYFFKVDFFSFPICDQRKEAKERRYIDVGF